MKKSTAAVILDRLDKEYPDADTMLTFHSVFELLIAVVLSAQSTDEQVNRVTAKLFAAYNQPQDFAAMDIETLEQYIKGVGLYRNKAKNIKELALILIDKYAGQVPAEFEELMKLPGVGRKTANVILAVGFKKPGLGVDTHVQRVANRLGLVNEKNPEKTEAALKKIIPENRWGQAHHLLIFHGRRVCKARKPLCAECVLEDLCQKRLV